MRLFLLPTGPVDNIVENSVRHLAKARLTGFLLVCPRTRQIGKVNKIKAFDDGPRTHLSDVSGFNRGVRVCISQVLTAFFLLHTSESARQYRMASAICAASGVSAPARSAIERATFNTR